MKWACNLNNLCMVKGIGGGIVECINAFCDIGKGLGGLSNDKSRVILGWKILVE